MLVSDLQRRLLNAHFYYVILKVGTLGLLDQAIGNWETSSVNYFNFFY